MVLGVVEVRRQQLPCNSSSSSPSSMLAAKQLAQPWRCSDRLDMDAVEAAVCLFCLATHGGQMFADCLCCSCSLWPAPVYQVEPLAGSTTFLSSPARPTHSKWVMVAWVWMVLEATHGSGTPPPS
jgi:hypothetical protein